MTYELKEANIVATLLKSMSSPEDLGWYDSTEYFLISKNNILNYYHQ